MSARLVVLVSGSGTNLQALLDAAADPAYGAAVVAVGADREDIEGLRRAERAGIATFVVRLDACADPSYGASVVAVGADRDGIEGLARAERDGVPTFVVPVSAFATRDDWDAALTEAVATHEPDLVVSAGFMKVVGKRFLERFTMVNTHPALLPAFPGAHAVRDALDYGVKVTGCTVHLVDSGVDTGPIIEQRAVDIRSDDDEATLHERIKTAERDMLVDVVGRMARHGWRLEGRHVVLGT